METKIKYRYTTAAIAATDIKKTGNMYILMNKNYAHSFNVINVKTH